MQYCKTVTLRTRPIKNGMLSYYLDYYPGYRDIVTMKTTRHESLGIYIYADPQNKREKDFNDRMTEKAEAIRCRRYESVVNERYDFFDKARMQGDFLDYFNRVLQGKTPSGSSSMNISSILSVANADVKKLTSTYATTSVSICLQPRTSEQASLCSSTLLLDIGQPSVDSSISHTEIR